MQQQIKYPVGNFIEIATGYSLDNNLDRKVTIVGRDGITCWDFLDETKSTPIIIHPVMEPKDLGSLADFLLTNNLKGTYKSWLKKSHELLDQPHQEDSLFHFRVIWYLNRLKLDKGLSTQNEFKPTGDELINAYKLALEQEKLALRSQMVIDRYVETANN